MLLGKHSVLTFNNEIIETNVYYDGEDFYYIDKNNDIITVEQSFNNSEYEYKI